MSGLFNSTVLDVAIGIVFVYLLLAIICTAANEYIAGLLKTRSKMLEKALLQLLDNQPSNTQNAATGGGDGKGQNGFLKDFYIHPLLTGMMRDKSHPSYLPARTFALAVMDLATPSRSGSITFADLEAGVKAMPDGDVKRTLLALLQNTNADLDAAQKAIEGWFDDTMDRVSGWYKRRTQLVTLLIALVITILTNADTIHVARRLWTDPVLRSAVVDEAKNRAQKPPPVSVEYKDKDNPLKPTSTAAEGNVISDKERALLGELIGWRTCKPNDPPESCTSWAGANGPERLLGWILTILAISLGAPFWFDLLNKFMNIRSAGKSPDEAAKKPEKKKLPPEDRAA
jgi:hypothetical protein